MGNYFVSFALVKMNPTLQKKKNYKKEEQGFLH